MKKEKTVNKEEDKAVEDFMNEIVDDLGYTPKKRNPAFQKRLTEIRGRNKSLILAGAGILLAILIILHFSAIGNKLSKEDLAPIQGEIGELKERIIALEGVERRLSLLEKRTEKSIQTAAAGARTIATEKRSNADGKIYHTVRKGDTLSSIGKRYGITAQELCKLNGMSLKQTLHLGQKLLVKN